MDRVRSQRIRHSRPKEEVQGRGGGAAIRRSYKGEWSAHALTFELETRYKPGVALIVPPYIIGLGVRLRTSAAPVSALEAY